MKEELIAPCGMNFSLCIHYQFMKEDLNKQGFNRIKSTDFAFSGTECEAGVFLPC